MPISQPFTTQQDMKTYYLGLDIGTSSVGFAITDIHYNILRKKGKDIFGFRLFDSGKTAAERRVARSSKRRSTRRRQRLELLQEFFSAEIHQVDSAFYQRLEQSFYFKEHKSIQQKNTLFNDAAYTDREYHAEFPTIYHLRHALATIPHKKFDIRLIYLAIAHILKKRGHFLFEGQNIGISTTEGNENTFFTIFKQFSEAVYTLVDRENEDAPKIDFCDMLQSSPKNITRLENILSERTGKNEKKKNLFSLFDTKDGQEKKFLELIAGSSVGLYDLFLQEHLKEDNKKICFSDANFEERHDEISQILGDKMLCISLAKAVYDWALLVTILSGNSSISKAKIESYDKHKNDLQKLKTIIKQQCPKKLYTEMFHDDGAISKNGQNYVAYIGKSKASNNKSACDTDTFYKYIKQTLKGISSDTQDYAYILDEIEKKTFLPRQSSNDNSVIPYQLHLQELEKILHNAEKHYPFLSLKCPESHLSISEKILAIMTFRIPYYIGPLNTTHKKEHTRSNAWAVRKENGKIYPWNIRKKIDFDATAEKFIAQMTNKCSYLIGADVLPKNSLLYAKFSVLNEINNIRVHGEGIPVSLKQEIYNDLFLHFPTITRKRMKNYLISRGILAENEDIEGIDEDFKGSMKPLLDLQKILGSKTDDNQLCESIILALTLFGEEKKLIYERLKAQYGGQLSSEEIKKLTHLKYTGWGRLSKKFLTEIIGMDNETGECNSIIESLYHTNNNLMQLLSYRYTYADEISKYNISKQQNGISKENIKETIQELYCSPAVKRSINQAVKIVSEIETVMGYAPEKIFIEVAREEGKKERTRSRKNTLLALYKKCKQDAMELSPLIQSLEGKSDADLRSKKLYLYYTQMGKCMYSGDSIEISELFSQNLYDIDHIYPRSKTKDDSFDNLVLVKKQYNQSKKDIYPLTEDVRTPSTKALWQRLEKMGLISKQKYNRLTRCEGFSEDELAGFISRQLVETRQSTKAVAQILAQLLPQTKIIYSKAGNISAFRQQFELTKVRELNDHHHAEDAYLNIVVGNVYHTKFTSNPLNFIKAPQRKYNLHRMYDYDIQRDNTLAWLTPEKAKKDGITTSIDIVRRTLQKKRLLFTRHSVEETGSFYDQQPLKKGSGTKLIPLKSTNPLLTVEDYGGYDNASSAYFFLVKHIVKKKEVRSIEFVPVYLAQSIAKGSLTLRDYCTQHLGLTNPCILLPKIRRYTLFNIGGFPMHITGRADERILFAPAVQLCLEEADKKYFKKVIKFCERIKGNPSEEVRISKFDGITQEQNEHIYNTLLHKHKESTYKLRPGGQISILEQGKENFCSLTVEEQCLALSKILQLFTCTAGTCDLKLIGGTANAGKVRKNKKLSLAEKPRIIAQSVTGLFTREIDLFAL